MFCIVIVLSLHVLYRFCAVMVVRVQVLCCNGGTCTGFVL
jgi:hypothetical protein